MTYIQFDKTKLINLEYSLSREVIRSNRSGAYASTTIVNCNTRKYHGLLVTPQPGIDDDLHVLLSTVDETVIQRDAAFNLALRKYPGGQWNPKGHKYLRDFTSDPIPTQIYRVGGVVLKRESLLVRNNEQTLIRYTLLDAHSPTTLRFAPFLLFRNRHALSRSNIYIDTAYREEQSGISMRLYAGYSRLFMQFSKEPLYTHNPQWFYNIEYIREQERGYDFSEDQFVPGFFDLPITKGETIILSASTKAISPGRLQATFNQEIKARIPRNSFVNCLSNSAQQFIVDRDTNTDIIAGFPWYNRLGRDSFIALPGLTLADGNPRPFRSVMKTMVSEMRGPLFPQYGFGPSAVFQSADTSLWFFWAIQQYTRFTADWSGAWKLWSKPMKQIIEGYIGGTAFKIKANEKGLIEAGDSSTAVTWMDTAINGVPVTPRHGMAVEINALWYNALMFYSEIAGKNNEESEAVCYLDLAEKVKASFRETFWCHKRRHLYDVVHGDFKDDTIRPNQIFAVSMPYKAIDDEDLRQVLDVVRSVLVTPYGLRSLSPFHPDYKGEYSGNPIQRDKAFHQGTVWPWLLGHYIEGWLSIYGSQGVEYAKQLLEPFEQEVEQNGLGSISEVYDGNPPHHAGGAFSSARSVAELLRIHKLINEYDRIKP
jgi:predicted glycogen debranching enzyme